MTNPNESTCPKCGAPLGEDAPQGLCPKCVLAAAVTLPEPSASPAGRTPPPPIEDIAPHFPDLEILELIGAGGMGAVYKARQPKLDRPVALKILSHDLAADPAFAERFNREAQVLARLNHPHIVTVFDFGTAGPYCYLLMEYVDGVNLRQAMHAGSFTPADSLAVVQDVCAALAFAHEEGILHRDIKPENVLIDSRGRVKIADFGIAKLLGEDDQHLVTLTMQGASLGSPHYMAPEQIETPADVDQRADIYSLGVVFYELLTGELPIGRFAPPSEIAAMDPRVDEVVMRTLEKERQARYQTAGEVQTHVEAITRTGAGAAVAPTAESATASSTGKQPAEAGTARLATASAILTGVSLLLGVPVLLFVILLYLNLAPQPMGSSPRPMPTGVSVLGLLLPLAGLLVWAVPALLGVIFGGIALGDIRRSGGRKNGLGRALFGALTWPVMLILALSGILMAFVLPLTGAGMGAGSISASVVTIISLAVGCAAALLFVWAVLRWVKQGPVGMHPALVVTGIVALLLLGPPSLVVLMKAPSPGRGPDHDFDLDDKRSVSSSSVSSHVKWAQGRPEIEVDLTVPPGHVATFDLVQAKPGGEPRSLDLDLCGYVVAPDSSAFQGLIRIGSERSRERQRPMVISIDEKGGGAVMTNDSLPDSWIFDQETPLSTELSTPGLRSFPMATIRNGDAAGSPPVETLFFQVNIRERTATDGSSGSVDEAIMDLGDDGGWIDDLK